MDRRDFIKLTVVTGTSATLASCGSPEHQLIRFVPDEELTPGVAEWKPSICPLCRAGCGTARRADRAIYERLRRSPADHVRILRRGRASARESLEFRPRPAADVRPRPFALRRRLRRRLSRHVEFAGVAERRVRRDAA